MKLVKARVRNYRSVIDTGWFDVEIAKTIMVGPNEAGKTAVLQALQQINPPPEVPKFDALRDYPRSKYNEITTKRVDPKEVTVVEAEFALDDEDRTLLPESMKDARYTLTCTGPKDSTKTGSKRLERIFNRREWLEEDLFEDFKKP